LPSEVERPASVPTYVIRDVIQTARHRNHRQMPHSGLTGKTELYSHALTKLSYITLHVIIIVYRSVPIRFLSY